MDTVHDVLDMEVNKKLSEDLKHCVASSMKIVKLTQVFVFSLAS